MYEFRSFSNKAIKVVPLFLVLAIISYYIGGPMWKSMSATSALVTAELMIMYIVIKIFDHRKRESTDEYYEPLTSSKAVRTAIVKDFADRYDIDLSGEQIDLIVRASYSSPDWEHEIQMMTREYNVVNEWYVHGKTEWLHLYLKGFKNMTITSDFDVQKKVVLKAFEEIIDESFDRDLRIVDCVERVNRKFFTVFDEISFMLLCKFMKEQGYNVILPEGIVIKNVSEIDNLISKWDYKTDYATEKSPELIRVLKQGNDCIRRISEVSKSVSDTIMSEKLYRLEKALKQIFNVLEKHPERLQKLHKFMDYYLPAIIKIVRTYEELNFQDIKGDSINKIKKEIEDNMDSINFALEKIAEKLYEPTSTEVSVDISVLSMMLERDGLTEKEIYGLKQS